MCSPIERGQVQQNITRKTSTFQCKVLMSLEGAYDTFAQICGDDEIPVEVMTRGATSTLSR